MRYRYAMVISPFPKFSDRRRSVPVVLRLLLMQSATARDPLGGIVPLDRLSGTFLWCIPLFFEIFNHFQWPSTYRTVIINQQLQFRQCNRSGSGIFQPAAANP